MEINELYNTARTYIEKIKKEKPFYFFEHDSSLCLIKTSKQIFCGTTCIKIDNGNVETVSSDYNAVLLFIANSKEKAEQIIVVMADDYRITVPFSESIQALLKAGDENRKCQIIISESQSISCENFCAASPSQDDSPDFFSGFDDSPIDAQPYNDSNTHHQQSVKYSQSSSNNINSMHSNGSQSSQYVSQCTGLGGGAFKRKLSQFLEDDEPNQPEKNNSSDNLSKKELLQQAKKNKKAAKRSTKF